MTSKKKLLMALASIMLMYGMVLSLEQLILNDVQELYEANAEIMGFAVSIKSAVMFIIPILMGLVADKKGKHIILLIFLVVNIVGCLTIGFSGSLVVYIIGTVIVGAGCSTCESMSSSILPDIDADRAAQNQNLVQTIFALGAGSAPIIISFLMNKGILTWRVGYYFIAACYVVVFIIFLKVRFPVSPLTETLDEDGETERSKVDLKQILTGLFIVCFIIMVIYLILENSFAYFIDSLTSSKNAGAAGAYALSFFWYGMAISRTYIATRKQLDEIKVIKICYIFSAVLIAAVTVVKNPIASVVLCLLAGVAFGPVWPTLVGYIGRKYQGAASLVSIIVAGGGLGGVIGPAITGTLAHKASFTIAFLVLCVFAVCGALLTITAKRAEEKEGK